MSPLLTYINIKIIINNNANLTPYFIMYRFIYIGLLVFDKLKMRHNLNNAGDH